jgi:hypothetical protein
MVAAVGLFIDQLTLGPLRNLVQYKSVYLVVDITLLVVSNITQEDRCSLIKPSSADWSLADLG